ncbi:hypothetical protein BDZ89DRAFT_1140671 [Hymenopellis radicata]|nr:hypothetical protein BDZ89DRAFT_1140671 [Hymenopellis radicata]
MPVPIPVPLRANANMRLEAKYNVSTVFPSFDLHSAAATGNMGLVEYALNRGQPINSVLDGVLPLHAACAGGNEQVVKLLIEHGADVNAPRLPRRYSNEKNRDASAPIVGTSGSTPLHFAAANGNTNIVTTLLLKGAHADRADKHGIIPEQLARQNGWLECADVLRKWLENKDKDLREREPPILDDSPLPGRTRQGSVVGSEGESSRKRLKMKRSVDTALSMLKASSSALSDAYIKPGSSSTPPASPIAYSGEDSLENGRASPCKSTCARRPSLPYLPSSGSPRPQKAAVLSKPPSSPRRPRSAGTGADRDAETNSPKGSSKKLVTKYSLMNIFKKSETNSLERIPSHTPSTGSVTSLAPSLPVSSPKAKSIPLPSSPPTSDSLGLPISSSPFSVSNLRHRMGSDAAQASPPSAVDLHNVMAQQQQSRRDRSGSSSSRFEPSGLGLTFDSNGSMDLSSSPASRSALRARTPSQLGHNRHRSGSTHRNATVFDDDVVVLPEERAGSAHRPSILRSHNRSSSSSGHGSVLQASLRALRFDSGRRGSDSPPLRGSNSVNSLVRFVDTRDDRSRSGSPAMVPRDDKRPPESAPPTISDFRSSKPHEDVQELVGDEEDEEDEYYGSPCEHGTQGLCAHPRRRRGPSDSSTASDMLSPSEFPFSIHNPPPVPAEDTTRRGSYDGRDRGDSVSSTTSTNPNLNFAAFFPGSLCGKWSQGLHRRGNEDELPLELSGADLNVATIGKLRVPLDIDIKHAQAEALVQRAQQDILEMAHDDEQTPSSKTPLSARLAAYGESLAKLRELQQQAEGFANRQLTVSQSTDNINRSCNRQRSMEDRLVAPSMKYKQPRRPHTSNGTSSNESIAATSTLSSETSRPSHHASRSASAMESFNKPIHRLPAGSLYMRAQPNKILPEQLSRVSSLDGADTDTELGPPLFRVSTAPHSSATVKGRREQARSMASANKLSRMGFSAPAPVARSPPPKRFGGLKSLMQTFKAKPAFD